jgi:hypothetical protein
MDILKPSAYLPPLVFSCSVEMKIFSAASRGAVPNFTRPGWWCDDDAPSSPLYAPVRARFSNVILTLKTCLWVLLIMRVQGVAEQLGHERIAGTTVS